jgi:cytochrome b-561 domain containing protein 2
MLMSQAVLTMSDNNYFTNNLEHKSRVYAHWVLQALAGVLITIAFSCIFINKVRMGKPHFQTTHALVGLTTICMTLMAIGGGVFTKYSFKLRTIVRPVYSKIGHSALGILTYMMAMATILLGIYSKWGEDKTTAEIRGVIFGILCVTTIYVLIKPMLLMASRFKVVLTRDNL